MNTAFQSYFRVRNLAIFCAMCCCILLTDAAQANDVVTFDLSNFAENQSSLSTTVDGVTLNFFDSRSNESFEHLVISNGDLAFFLQRPTGDMRSFQMAFSAPVKILSYEISNFAGIGGDDAINFSSSAGSTSESFPFSVGTRDFDTQFSAAANSPIKVTGSGTPGGFDAVIAVSSITVEVLSYDAPITYDLTNFVDASGHPTLTTSSDGVTLDFFDSIKNGQQVAYWFADSDGVAFIGNEIDSTFTFKMAFDAPVKILSYEVGFLQNLEPTDAFFLVSPTSGTAETFPFSLGGRDFNTQFPIAANVPIAVSTTNMTDDIELVQLSSMTVQPLGVNAPRMVEVDENNSFVQTITTSMDTPTISIPVALEIPPIANNELGPGEFLELGGENLVSPNGNSNLAMTSSGDLISFDVNIEGLIWASGTSGTSAEQARMNPDGNFVVPNNVESLGNLFMAITSSPPSPGSRLQFQDGGKLVILRADGEKMWESTLGDLNGGGTTFNPAPLPVVGLDNHLFEIVNGDQLQFINLPVFDNPLDANGDNVYEVSVAAENAGGVSDSRLILVTVASNPLSITSADAASVPENTTLVHSITTNLDDVQIQITGTDAGQDILGLNQSLSTGETLSSEDGANTLLLQDDGNLVLYQSGQAIWATGTQATFANTLLLDSNNNLVLLSNNTVVWDAGITPTGDLGTYLKLENDGQLVVYRVDGERLWESTLGSFNGAGTVFSPGPVDPAFQIAADNQLFELIGTELHFKSAPDFEAPLDQGGTTGDNIYEVSVVATTESGMLDSQVIQILVTDEDDVVLGDVNQDGVVNLLDVNPFIEVLGSSTYQFEADINGDGVVNLLDVNPFIALLSGS